MYSCSSVNISKLIHSPKSCGGWKLKFVKTNGIFGPCRHCLDGGKCQYPDFPLVHVGLSWLLIGWGLPHYGWVILGRCKFWEKYEAENVIHGPLTRLSTEQSLTPNIGQNKANWTHYTTSTINWLVTNWIILSLAWGLFLYITIKLRTTKRSNTFHLNGSSHPPLDLSLSKMLVHQIM